jgi:NADPH:quinone reductase-like Zn-dependent oxidoreductase
VWAGVVASAGEIGGQYCENCHVGKIVADEVTISAISEGVRGYSEWIAVRKEDLCLIPDNIDDVSAAGIPVAYLTAQVALTLAGFRAGKTVLAPAIGGSVDNAVTNWRVP